MASRALLVLLLAACQGKDSKAPPPKPPADAAIEVDWVGCGAALKKAATLPQTRRAQAILDGCQPCGDWAPLLHWNVLTGEGGPTRLAIEGKMLACGYCEPNAKQRFLGVLDNARGTESRAPWRVLGEVCGDRVSAVPDGRFMSAPYYALDRIARAAAQRPELAPLLPAIEIPLPAVSVTGAGYQLPTSPVTSPLAGPPQITLTMTEIRYGQLPRAKLGATGLTLVAGGEPYPGALVEPAKLPALLAGVTGIAVIAPVGLPAKRILELVELADGHDLRLAVVGPGSPEGWVVPGTIPVTLSRFTSLDRPRTLTLGDSADPAIVELKATPAGTGVIAIELAPGATAATLARLLGALAFGGGHAAMLVSKP